MTDIVFKFVAIIGIAFVVILFFIKYSSLNKTEEGKEYINAGKKALPANALVSLISGFMFGAGYGSHPYNALGFKLTHSVDEHVIPGTMNVGIAVPAFVAVILFQPHHYVDMVTLFAIAISATLGAITGSGFVGKMNLAGVRLMVGLGSLILGIVTVIFFFVANRGPLPEGTALTAGRLILAVIIAMLLGNLMNVGTGFTIPCITMCLLMGLSLQASLAIAIFSVAFMTAFGNSRVFIFSGKIDFWPCLCQFIFGSVGVAVSFFLFKNGAPIIIFTAIAGIVAFLAAIIYLKDYATSSKKRKAIESKEA